jgi:pantoate kinase
VLRVSVARAFAPATITNFFAVHHKPGETRELSHAGATGGGYIVSRGVITKATAAEGRRGHAIEIVVDGDANYNARTTRTAVRLMLERTGAPPARLRLEQTMQVPVGYGFGASAASALSGVFATASALGLVLSKEEIASFAHQAEILQQTGLGTVSAAYDGTGAGIIYEPGAPGIAKFRNVSVQSDIRIVTASLAPYVKGDLLSSKGATDRINRLGTEALSRVMADPTLECMASSGEWFTEGLGLMSPAVKDLAKNAKAAGALYSSQNMVGQAMHAVVPISAVDSVVTVLASSRSRPRVDVLEIGIKKAAVLEAVGRA